MFKNLFLDTIPTASEKDNMVCYSRHNPVKRIKNKIKMALNIKSCASDLEIFKYNVNI